MDIAALRASWRQVEALGDEAPALFYAMLFTLAPELRAMFPIAMTAQRDRLLGALGHIVSHVDDEPELVAYVEQLGRDHRRFGVSEQHYPIVGRALLATLQRALGHGWTQQLAADWTAAYQLIAKVMSDAGAKASITTPPWWDAAVVLVERRSAEIAVLTVAPTQAFPFDPGQSIAIEYPRRPRLWRYLSPANAPRPDATLEFHVRAIAAGQVSPALVYRCTPGETLRLGAPVGTALSGYRRSDQDLLLIAGGTGLAPLRSIVEDLANNHDRRRVTLVVGANTVAGLYDLPVLAELQGSMPSLTVIPAVVDGPLGPAQRGTAVQVALTQHDWSGHEIYVCGSPRMVFASRMELQGAGFRDGQIITERLSYRNQSQSIGYVEGLVPGP